MLVGEKRTKNFSRFFIVVLGLADGAGGNRSLGINPADFSRAILASCREILRRSKVQSHQLASVILSAMHQVEASRIRGEKQRKMLFFVQIEFI